MISKHLSEYSRHSGDREAVRCGQETWTFGQLYSAGALLGAELDALAGLRVGVSIEHFPLLVTVLFALDGLRATVCLLSPVLRSSDVAELAAKYDIELVLTDSHFAQLGPHTFRASVGATASTETRAVPKADEGEVILFTSGTSGPPRPVVHTWRSLSFAVNHHPRYADRRWLLTYNVTGFAGLQILLQSLLTGGRLSVPPSRSPDELLQCLLRDGVELASGTPTMWRMLIQCTKEEDLAGSCLQQITLGGEAVDQFLLDGLQRLFPNARVGHIYASTEMGTCFVVNDHKAGFPVHFLTDATLPCQLRVSDEGELLIRSRRAMNRYLDREWDSTSWFASGDLVSIQGERVLFMGRRSECVNVGGNKVFPLEVEEVIRAVPGVRQVRVKAVKSSMVGELVGADIECELGQDLDALKRQILATCRSKLAKYKVPAIVNFQPRFELTESGKIARSGA